MQLWQDISLWLEKWLFSAIMFVWFLCVAIGAYFLINEHTTTIDNKSLQKILQEEIAQEILIDSTYTYFYMQNDSIYKIPTTHLYACLFGTHTAHVKNKSDTTEAQLIEQQQCGIYLIFKDNALPHIAPKIPLKQKILYAILIFLFGWILLYYYYDTWLESKLFEKASLMDKYEAACKYEDQEERHRDEGASYALEPMKSSVRFKDVAGIKDAKDDLLEIIDYLKNPKKYQDLGIYLPKGVLLVGPPGVGKTMIAKAIAGESGVPFFYHSGSSFVQVYVGVGAKRVRELFARARACAPSIIFIDEIDAIGKARGADNSQEWESTLNELLVELDGFNEQSGVIVIGATNQVDVMDYALLRSGRFDRRIYIDLPDLEERAEILKVHLQRRAYTCDLHEVAKLCVGFSGANIAALINEAALNALRHGRNAISMQDITDTSQRVLFGKRRQNALNSEEKQMLGIYNAAKALSQYWLAPDFQKIMLIESTQELREQQDSYEYCTKNNLLAQIKIALSGNIALEMQGIGAATIAQHDVERAKNIARKMCDDYGMGERLVTDYEDIAEILESAKEAHREFIVSHSHFIMQIATKLIEQEKITKEEIQRILETSI